MTKKEKDAYLDGVELINATKHRDSGMKTTSIGFCFAELTDKRDADKWLRKLIGTRPCEYCIMFDTDDFKESLAEGIATYADDTYYDVGKTMEAREWSTTNYRIDTHPYKRIGRCPSIIEFIYGRKIEWL